MERTQCLFENEVEYNLSESGVLPMRIEEVLEEAEDPAKFLSLGLKYAYSTGAVLTEEEMDEIVRGARKANAWLLVDEIYRGAEAGGPLTPTFWGRYDKLLITSGLSKAFGMPGLRLGWIVGPPKMIAKVCTY